MASLCVSAPSSVMTVVKSRTFREKQGKILLEGRRLIADALKAGAVPKMFFFSRLDYLRELPAHKLKGVRLVKVKFEDIKEWSDLVTPQGIMGQWLRGVSPAVEAWGGLFMLVSGSAFHLNQIQSVTEDAQKKESSQIFCKSCIF